MGRRVLTHPALLKPALQAWRASLGYRDQVLMHLSLLRSALQAWGALGRSRGDLGAVVQLTEVAIQA